MVLSNLHGGLGSSPGGGDCIVFLDKTLNSHNRQIVKTNVKKMSNVCLVVMHLATPS